MHCPNCHCSDTRVVDSRVADDGNSIRRRRQCTKCGSRFTTLETFMLQVEKRSGILEPFSREKIIAGIRKASEGLPIQEDQLARVAQQVEESLRSRGKNTVTARQVGEALLPFLKDLDQVTYLRFASVYAGFQTIDDFQAVIDELREHEVKLSATNF